MKLVRLGSSVRVDVGAVEIDEFCRRLPTARLPFRKISFVFDSRSFDLEEVFPARSGDCDGIAELCEDAKAFATAECRAGNSPV